MVKKLKKYSQSGFSLLEVLIAMTVFAVFATMYVTSQGFNIADSSQMREEIFLKTLAEQVLNEIIMDPPEFKESLTLTKESKTFSGYDNYKYEIEYKKFQLPDLAKIQGKEEGEEAEGDLFTKTIMKTIKDNMEKMIWQVKVTVINKETTFNYSLSSWLMNHKAEIKVDKI